MLGVDLGEQAALSLILSSMSVKDLLHFAVKGLSQDETVQAQDRANICLQAINTFLS
ncbi:MAG: hypothetical protein LIO65_00140 [Odoribacter sp.]|nr:hypothetical protein [Odoribacter sp.]